MATTRLGLLTVVTGDTVSAIRDAITANAGTLDDAVLYQQGVIASRPTSTAGSPGTAGREYRSTDGTPIMWKDTGTSWLPLTSVSFSAGVAGSQAINASTYTKVTLTEEWDDVAAFSTSRFVAPFAGVYRFSLGLLLDPLANGYADVCLYKNGSLYALARTFSTGVGGVAHYVGLDRSAAAAVNDYFEMYAAYIATGDATRRVLSGSFFEGALVRPS